MATLVPDVACCVFIGVITFSTSQSNLVFTWDYYCHLIIDVQLQHRRGVIFPSIPRTTPLLPHCWKFSTVNYCFNYETFKKTSQKEAQPGFAVQKNKSLMFLLQLSINQKILTASKFSLSEAPLIKASFSRTLQGRIMQP